MGMNSALKDLYLSKWDLLISNASQLRVKAANPLLIQVGQAYIDSEIKVMIVGQETDGWHHVLNEGNISVERLMNGYSDYFNQASKDGKGRGRRAFWNRKNYRFFEEQLSKYFRGKSVSFIWNNISKIGNENRGKPHKLIRQLEREHFNIFASEFAILNPDIVIFTTGSSRDSYIVHHFGSSVSFLPKLSLLNGCLSEETLNLIAEVKLPKFPSVKAIRIEHPNRRTLSNSLSLEVLKCMLDDET